jgi:hypothetical protein
MKSAALPVESAAPGVAKGITAAARLRARRSRGDHGIGGVIRLENVGILMLF